MFPWGSGAGDMRPVVEDVASLGVVDPGVQLESAALLINLTAHVTAQVVALGA